MSALPLPFSAPSVAKYVVQQVILVTLLLALTALALHYSGLDVRVQGVFFDSTLATFPWRRNEALELVGHQLLKFLPISLFLLALIAAICAGRRTRLRPWRTHLWCLAAALCLGPTVVTQLKQVTAPLCPWDLQQYGGARSSPSGWFINDLADAGRCLPSGHAGAGYAMLALYFAGWASGRPRWRWQGLVAGILLGTLFGAIRIVQGAHFLSHVVWAATVCWLIASLAFLPVICAGASSQDRNA